MRNTDGIAVSGDSMRTSPSKPTDVEIAAFTRFAFDHDIIVDGEVGVRNADILCGPIINADFDITAQTLQESFARVKAQLQIKSATYKKADELASKLSPEEIDAYKAWAKNQKLLIGLDGSPEGYQNVATLLGWFRGNPVTSHNLDLALGNVVNNAKFGRIHFKPQPRQQDRGVVQGKPNHAFGLEEPKPKVPTTGLPEHVNGRKNHAYVPPEEAAKKVTVQAPDAWQEIINLQMREWTTPGQQVKLQNELNAGLAAGRSRRDISTSLAAIIRDQQRGR
jgi:hypothetical protein